VDFDTLLARITALLQRQSRVSYGALKRRFALDDDYLQDLKDELINARRVAIDEDGKVLVWVGKRIGKETENRGNGESEQKPPAADARRQTLDPRRDAGERRQLTVMFCDLVGSTALSTQLDPEDLREIIRRYQQTCAEVIRRYEGYVAQYLGDGLLVYLGYPAAHEDDAVRAVRAGLEIIEAFQHPLLVRHKVPSPLAGEGQGEGASGSAGFSTTSYPDFPT
jgi:class 3 adenylate cyclase